MAVNGLRAQTLAEKARGDASTAAEDGAQRSEANAGLTGWQYFTQHVTVAIRTELDSVRIARQATPGWIEDDYLDGLAPRDVITGIFGASMTLVRDIAGRRAAASQQHVRAPYLTAARTVRHDG